MFAIHLLDLHPTTPARMNALPVYRVVGRSENVTMVPIVDRTENVTIVTVVGGSENVTTITSVRIGNGTIINSVVVIAHQIPHQCHVRVKRIALPLPHLIAPATIHRVDVIVALVPCYTSKINVVMGMVRPLVAILYTR